MNNLHSPIRLLVITMVSIFLVATLVMFSLLSMFPALPWWQQSLLAVILLCVFLFPLLLLFFLKPLQHLTRRKNEGAQALAQERQRTAELKTVNERLTQELVERREADRELSEAGEMWEEIFSTINEAITIHDREFNIIQANRAARELLGLSDDFRTQKCFLLFHGTDTPPARCPSCTTLHTGKSTVTELFEPHLNRYLEVKAFPRLNESGEIIGVIHIVRDIGERKRSEEEQRRLQAQLIQSQKMETIGRLAGGVAHDFNNILTIILSYTGLALRTLPPESKVAEHLDQIREAGERAAILARQLLAFSRKQNLDIRVVDLNEIINNMMKMVGRVIGENITLQLDLQDAIPKVMADAGQIEQIIMNLTVNARDAMPEGGSLTIASSRIEMDEQFITTHEGALPGTYAMFSVTDTGCGIPLRNRTKVFEPFFTTKTPEMGTGLGLSTVYGIVKQHNGFIYLTSEEGKGSTFEVYLPTTSGGKPISRSLASDSMPRGTETILLAEDDKYVLHLLEEMLRPLGYQVLAAADGKEALRMAQQFQGRIDLLLTDVIMPGLNGRELADQLRAERPEIKVIFVSGYTDEALTPLRIQEGSETFLQKPLPSSQVLRTIRQILDGS